jgi:hypothetical protein
MRTCPAAGSGSGTSAITKFSGPPHRRLNRAFINAT